VKLDLIGCFPLFTDCAFYWNYYGLGIAVWAWRFVHYCCRIKQLLLLGQDHADSDFPGCGDALIRVLYFRQIEKIILFYVRLARSICGFISGCGGYLYEKF
jgi:hypothetical protein